MGKRSKKEKKKQDDQDSRGHMDGGPASWSVVTDETPDTLLEKWKDFGNKRQKVIAFYQARKGTAWRVFSNFYDEKEHAFDFVLPQQLLEIAGVSTEQKELFAPIVHCHFSEKAIMLCKAAVMGDAESYTYIAAANTPMQAKNLGRQIKPWHEDRWASVVCGIAVAVLRQKFAVPELRDVLLRTGHRILCEAAASDRNWGIGFGLDKPKVYKVPALWKGSNILGWALMEVRTTLQAEQDGLEASS